MQSTIATFVSTAEFELVESVELKNHRKTLYRFRFRDGKIVTVSAGNDDDKVRLYMGDVTDQSFLHGDSVFGSFFSLDAYPGFLFIVTRTEAGVRLEQFEFKSLEAGR